MTLQNQDRQAATRPAAPTRSEQTLYFRPRVDIVEDTEEYLLMADMPGSSEENIELEFEDGLLTLHGKVAPRHPEHQEYIVQQYAIGDYRRSFRIDETIDASQITARYAAGVLTVRLPKAAQRKPRKIAVAGV